MLLRVSLARSFCRRQNSKRPYALRRPDAAEHKAVVRPTLGCDAVGRAANNIKSAYPTKTVQIQSARLFSFNAQIIFGRQVRFLSAVGRIPLSDSPSESKDHNCDDIDDEKNGEDDSKRQTDL